jgi:RNA polymerase sigma-70 factor (ECF subfamily)
MRTATFETEFLSIHDSYADSIFRLCYAKTGNRDEAKDLTQETFLRVWDRLGKEGAEIENLKAFLFTVARNLIKDYYKKKKPVLARDLPEGAMENVPLEVDVTLEGESKILLAALKDLSDPYREALMLHLVEGLPIGEIAKMLGERPNTISVRVKRGLLKARKALNINEP